jgi:hypothetical protein
LFRREQLARILHIPGVYGADRVVLLRVVMQAPVVCIDEPLRIYNHYYTDRVRSITEYMRYTTQMMVGPGVTVAPDHIWRHQLARAWLFWHWYFRLFQALIAEVWRSNSNSGLNGNCRWRSGAL